MNIEKIKEQMIIALRIRKEMQNIFKKHNVDSSYYEYSINQCHNQTSELSEGFICEYYYSSPSKIYTPLGYISIWESSMWGGKNHDIAVKEIEETFGFVLKEEARNDFMGTHGPWYHITKLPWEDTKLKCDSIEKNRNEYIEYNEAKKLYEEILSTLDYNTNS